MITFCTLFDSFYLDKGIALYKSLKKVSSDFSLYIFCFDDKAFDVLNKMNLSSAIIIHHSAFENQELLQRKKERTKAEYCWTCTPVIIEYVLSHFPVNNCTYIDADLYFFSNPQVLFDEINEAGANIVITEHRFSNSFKDKRILARSGKYCVEFNYFDQSLNSREALNWWKGKCLDWCYDIYEKERFGDQKYLESFPVLFNGVHELKNLGGGVAPWNMRKYKLNDLSNKEIELREKKSNTIFPIIFFHFQNIKYINNYLVNICSESHSKRLKHAIYYPYLKCIEMIRKDLKQYGLEFKNRNVKSSNRFIAFLQKNILIFKIKSISDIVDLRKLR